MSIVDLHCDTISRIMERGEQLLSNSCHFDVKRAITAGIKLQFFAVFVMPGDSSVVLRKTLLQVERFHREVEENSDLLYVVGCRQDIERERSEHRMGCLLHLEGAEAIGRDISLLHLLHRLDVRSIGLTWNHRNLLADGVMESESGGGLSLLGRKIISEMEKLGMLLDLAHIGEKAYYEALDAYGLPPLVTHANARALCDHPRNLSDSQLKALAANRGIVGINQVSDFVSPVSAAWDDFMNHIAYIADLIGVEHVALGSDFDGADNIVATGVEDYCIMEERLGRLGFSKREIKLILKDNALRVIKEVLPKNDKYVP